MTGKLYAKTIDEVCARIKAAKQPKKYEGTTCPLSGIGELSLRYT